MEIHWDGVTQAATISDEWGAQRNELADAARRYDWNAVFARLAEHPESINCTRPGGTSWYTPLHQAAHGGAPVAVVDRLIGQGAWRTLRSAHQERPVDIAQRRGHVHLLEALEPVYRHHVPLDVLARIERHLNEVIRGRAAQMVAEEALRLPELEPLLELELPTIYLLVPGMYGGFHYTLEADGPCARLVTESWCRVAGGSGQRHVITAAGFEMVAEGFV